MGDVVSFKIEEVDSLSDLLESVKTINPDSTVVLCKKDGEIMLTHNGVDTKLEIIGSLQALQMWLWDKGD